MSQKPGEAEDAIEKAEEAVEAAEAAEATAALASNDAAAQVDDLSDMEVRRRTATLLFSIMVIATNGVIYELLIGGYSSYLLGDSITQFSLTIGLFMSSMGIGSWLTQFFERDLERRFIEVEVALAVVGGPTVLLLAMAHIHTRLYTWAMFGMIIAIGALIGFEIPLVTRIVHKYGSLKKALANVLSFDYIGALVGALAFPLVLLPELGFARTSFFIGLVSLGIGILNLRVFRDELGAAKGVLWAACGVSGVFLMVGMLFSAGWIEKARERASGQALVFKHHSSYQTLRFVREDGLHGKPIYRLFINGEHQFSTDSEHRYHEMLVHPAIAAAKSHKRVLVLGGGDGLALRELWRYKGVKEVVLVDLDPAMTKWARKHPVMVKFHGDAFKDKRLKVLHEDAFLFVQKKQPKFDVIIMDLPVATNIALSKLYSATFFRRLRNVLAPGGAIVTEAAVLDAVENRPFWCLVTTMKAAGWAVQPFVEATMAYVMMTHKPIQPKQLALKVKGTRYATNWLMRAAFALPPDVRRYKASPVNTLDTHALLHLVLALR